MIIAIVGWSAASAREPLRLSFERLLVGSYSRISEAAHDGSAGFLARNPETSGLSAYRQA
jgi:hypothetical protein